MIRVLQVDDEPAILELTKILLGRGGNIRVDTAPSPVHALEMARVERYDAIVSDYLMPGMNGIEFLKRIRASGDRTPFILFTGKGREETAIEALNSGASFYLRKGSDPRIQFAELRFMIEEAVRRHRREELLRAMEHTLERAPDEIFWLSGSERFLYANETASRNLGYSREELLQIPPSAVNPILGDALWSAVLGELRASRNALIRSVHCRKDGSSYPVEISAGLAFIDGQEFCVIHARDISARQETEIGVPVKREIPSVI